MKKNLETNQRFLYSLAFDSAYALRSSTRRAKNVVFARAALFQTARQQVASEKKHAQINQSGFILPAVLSFMFAASIFAAAVLMVILNNFFVVGTNIQSQQAFNIAEAGANYYLWHLSHNGQDFKDGLSTPATPDATLGYGPYVHNYLDSNAQVEGTFTLWIKPAGNGSTIMTVRSIGQVTGTSSIRTVQVQIGATSFANYGLLSDTALWFGSNETADGPVFSNQGIRMDGPNTASVYSANTTYVPSGSLGGDGSSHPGVWCNSSVTTPVNCNTRNKSSWVYPYTSVDFNQVSTSLCTIKKLAFAADPATSALAGQANACTQTPATRTAAYIPQLSSTYSATAGYLIKLNTNGTYDLSSVSTEKDTQTTYSAALSPTSVATGITIPASGVIFAEDNVWVMSNPTYHGRVTIAAGRLATASNANITIANPLVYSTKNGSDAIGLIAQGNVYLAPYIAPSSGSFNIEVDAAVLAQSGSVWYPSNYRSGTQTCTRGWVASNQVLNFYGSVASRQTWTWSWDWGGSACGNNVKDPVSNDYISGFLYNTTQYDTNLLYGPPPNYPVTGGYSILSWREVLTKP